jgi:hypothetical protein
MYNLIARTIDRFPIVAYILPAIAIYFAIALFLGLDSGVTREVPYEYRSPDPPREIIDTGGTSNSGNYP